jgi:hypothetical protein
MLNGFIKVVIPVGISALLAVFIVKVFDDWYQDCEERRAHKRAQRAEEHHNRYE